MAKRQSKEYDPYSGGLIEYKDSPIQFTYILNGR
jgi:hypothetical protein